MERAAFVISIDTEMAWGLNHRQQETYRYELEREHIARLLDLFDRYGIPATWAIVGHLMLSGCSPSNGVKHPEIVRPNYEWFDGDWFDEDPCCSADDTSAWYAPDVVDRIRGARVDHEIASHGFSHVVAGDPGCSRASFDSELAASVAVAAELGLSIRSLVHPRNRIGHLDLLPEHGIVAYRGRSAAPERSPRALTRAGQRLVDLLAGSERTAIRPIWDGTAWNLPATVLFDVDPRIRYWKLWIRQAERRLDQAVRRRSLFHVWFHPHNLRQNPETAFAALARLLEAAAERRDRGQLDAVTMGELAGILAADRP